MKRVLITIILVLAFFYTGLMACTDIAVGKLATVDGSVISAQSVDGSYDSRLLIQPAADHEPGSMTPVWEWIIYADRRPLVQLGEIPQVEHTYQWIQTSYPFSNEKGLLMGESTISGSRATVSSPDAIMTIEQMQAFALPRFTTA
nr:peptidase U34 [Mesotoga sp.]